MMRSHPIHSQTLNDSFRVLQEVRGASLRGGRYVANRNVNRSAISTESSDSEAEDYNEYTLTDDVELTESSQYEEDEEEFGEALTQHIIAFNNVKPLKVSPRLSITPFPHQLLGAARMLFLEQSKYRGWQCADPMGMDKTIQTIILIVSTERGPDEGPTISVTKKSLVSNWLEELQMAVSRDAPLKVLVPDSEVKSYYQTDALYTSDKLHYRLRPSSFTPTIWS